MGVCRLYTKWTHPLHRFTALVATVLSPVVLIMSILAVLYCTWYVDHRKFNKKPRNIEEGWKSEKIRCTDTHCHFEEKLDSLELEGWRLSNFYLILVGIVLNFISFIILVLVFWPLTLFGKVFNCLLLVCVFLEGIGGFLKFIASMWVISFMPSINRSYSTRSGKNVVQLNTGPTGLLQLSFVLEMVCMLFLLLSRDVGPPGGPTHIERLTLERNEDEMHEAERKELNVGRRRSSYIPDVKKSHELILSKSKSLHSSDEPKPTPKASIAPSTGHASKAPSAFASMAGRASKVVSTTGH